ncbi:MAG: GGDEF domain-containing protein [Planctomycetes bacterium]|nr:GGDEF domain-containing protein [Planctomycetota bacterium]
MQLAPASLPHPAMTVPDNPDYSRTVYNVAPARLEGQGRRLPVLVVLRGNQVGRRYLLNENVLVLGRRADRSQLVVAGDALISSQHCRFERAAGADQWRVVDLQSTNGTVVGVDRVTTRMLQDGDRLLIGETVMKFTFHDELEEEFHRQVDHLMNVDDLTGLPVQRVFQAKLHDALLAARRHGDPMTVFMMDMDGLKKINDAFGHLVGAASIATVGKRLGALIARAGGMASRFGGDEFSAFVPRADRALTQELGEAMRRAVADEPILACDITVAPTISIGFAVHPDDGVNVEQLTRAADEALYRAKAAGRNCVRA